MTKKSTIRVGIVQRVIAIYRKPFFEKLARVNDIALSVFFGQSSTCEAIKTTEKIHHVYLFKTKNHYFLGPLGIICWQQNIIKWINNFNPDIVILEANPRILSNWLVIYKMKQRKKPIVGWGLGNLERHGSCLQVKIREKIARFFNRQFDEIIAYSTKAANDYSQAGLSPEKIRIAYNAIDNEESLYYLSKFQNDKTWIHNWKKSFNFSPDLPIVLFVGRLIPQKRADLLIRACIPLFNKCQLLLVGDGPERQNLENITRPFHKNIHFTGHLTGEDLARCFMGSDVFVLPGLGGLSIQQAMSYGKPVIVSFGDGTEIDLVEKDRNGVFFERDNVQSLTEAIEKLINSPNMIIEMGKYSLKIVNEKININSMLNNFINSLTHIYNTHNENIN